MRSMRRPKPTTTSLPSALDLMLAMVLAGLAMIEIWVEPIFQTGIPGPRLPLTLLLLVAMAAVAVRNIRPAPAWAGFVACTVLVATVGDRDQAAFELALGAMLLALALGAREETTRSVTSLALGAAVVTGAALWTYGDSDSPVDIVVPLVFIAASWAVGRELRSHRRLVVAAEMGRTAAEREREARVEAARMVERTRLARELHDVVAHGVSIMGLQAAALRTTLPPAQTRDHDALRDIEETARTTLSELHLMLDHLRVEPGSGQTRKAPGLDDLAALCRSFGAPEVSIRTSGDRREVSAAVEAAAYRIVQEALSNARRHASASRATVEAPSTRSSDCENPTLPA